jgi:rod shape-determining protein MreD
MRNVIASGAAIFAAFFAHEALRLVSVPLLTVVNVFALAVILFALVRGEMAGAILGAVCGLVADSLSLGVFGVSGVALTVTGFLTGYVSRKINVLPVGRMLVFLGFVGTLELGLWVLLSSLIFGAAAPWQGGIILFRPLATAVLGTILFAAYRKVKSRHER